MALRSRDRRGIVGTVIGGDDLTTSMSRRAHQFLNGRRQRVRLWVPLGVGSVLVVASWMNKRMRTATKAKSTVSPEEPPSRTAGDMPVEQCYRISHPPSI
jgi:hypothetical protein